MNTIKSFNDSALLQTLDSLSATSTTHSNVQFLSAWERTKRFGLECTGPKGSDGITFKAGEWVEGGEYVLKLTFRNVTTTVKKFKYKLPATRFFSMEYPEVITLSPGMFKDVDVFFRPVTHDPYDDTIYVKMIEGEGSRGFHVPCRALIEKLVATAPDGVDLGYSPVAQTTTATFNIVNEGEIDAPFRWECPPPFVVEPARGIIPMGRSQAITVSIFPDDASVFVSQGNCFVGEDVHAIIPEPVVTVRFSSIGKHAFISLSDDEVNFGEILTGTQNDTVSKEVTLRNTSVVPAEFELIRHEADTDEVFELYPKRGVVAPMSEIHVRIKFNALATGTYTLDRYTYKTPGNCRTTITCRGRSMPPKLVLYKDTQHVDKSGTPVFNEGSPCNSINFSFIEVGKTETRLFFLKNESNMDAYFSVVADEEGVFKINPKQGKIPALAKYFPIKLFFTPDKPINFYRRIFVLINEGLPLFYDVMGSGHIYAKGEVREQRPAPLRHAHIQAYKNRTVHGVGGLNPDELDTLYSQGLGKREFFALVGLSGTQAIATNPIKSPLTRSGESTRDSVAVAHEFFLDDSDPTAREITCTNSSLNFGYAPYMGSSDAQTVVITNRTRGKVCVVWNRPRIHSVAREEKKEVTQQVVSKYAKVVQVDDPLRPVFDVEPPADDIAAGESTTFKIYFRPKQANRNYFSELEAFVFFKNQRTFRLVEDSTLVPPWCVTVQAMGHTFDSGQLLAKGKPTASSIRGGKLAFPCCYKDEAVYQTVMIRNTSNLPCIYELQLGWDGGDTWASIGGSNRTAARARARLDEVFSVKPRCGEIAAEDFVLVCIRFSPTETKKYTQLLRCIINGCSSGQLLLEGSCDTPFIYFPDLRPVTIDDTYLGRTMSLPKRNIPTGFQGSFFLQPTCVGLSFTRGFTIKNGSRLPVRYRLFLPSEAHNVLSITPVSGLLKGNETLELKVVFVPKKTVRYDFKIKMATFPVGGKSNRILDCRQIGEVDSPETLQSLIFNVVCPGEVSALTFDPGRLTMNVRLVNTFETKQIFIENVSDASLSYQLFYKIEFTPDSAMVVKVRQRSGLRALYRSRDELDSKAEELAEPADKDVTNIHHSLFCEYPSGTLPARSRKCVLFTFYPHYAGLFEFLVYARLQALDPVTGKSLLVSNEEAAMLRVSQQDRDGVVEEGNISQIVGGDLTSVPLMTNITARAAFPTMIFEDIRAAEDALVGDIDSLWARFDFEQLNQDMSTPPTEEEIALYTASSPDISKFRRFNFEFIPGVVGSPKQTIFIQVRNNGFLQTTFTIHLPNEKELDLEPWCDEDEPSEELNKIISIIEELKCFTFEPRHVSLAPGETCMLTLSYSHAHLKYEGFHQIPLMVKIDTGKMFYIDLTGRTLPNPNQNPNEVKGNRQMSAGVSFSAAGVIPTATAAPPPTGSQSQVMSLASSSPPPSDILLMVPAVNHGSDHIVLAESVAIGLNPDDAPRQRTEIVNVSGSIATYEVDMGHISHFNTQNLNQPLMRLVNPKGTIQPRSSIFLEWYFYPLEVRAYDIPIKVTYVHAPLPTGFGMLSMDSLGSRQMSGSSTATSKRGGGGDRSPTRGATKKSTVSTSHGKLKTQGSSVAAAVANAPHYLDFVLRISGYDPREPRPLPLAAAWFGGLPPIAQLMTVQGQQALLSNDFIDFEVVPQHCSSSRIVTMANILPNSAVEFLVDDSTSFLASEGLLKVSPAYGRIEPGDHVVLDLTLTALAQPLTFSDRLKLIVREVVKDSGHKRAGGMTSRLKDRLKKKTKPADHESVITHTTFATTVHFEEKYIPDGRIPNLPSTMNGHGYIIEPSKSTSVVLGSGAEGDDKGHSSAANLSWVSQMSSTGFDNTIPATGRSGTTETSSGGRKGGGFRTARSGSGASIGESRPGTGASGVSGASGSRLSLGSRGGSRNGDVPTLLGPSAVVILRLRGEVFTVPATTKLLALGPRQDLMKGFLMPLTIPFVVPAPYLPPPVEVNHNAILEDPDDAEAFSTFSGSAGSGSRTKTASSAASPVRKQPNRMVVNKAPDVKREPEIRDVTEEVLFDVFRSILTLESVKEYASAVLDDAARASATTGGVRFDPQAEEGEELSTPLVNDPVYGVYYQDILPPKSLCDRLVREVKHMGHTTMDFDAALQASAPKGKGTSLISEVVPGIPAQWKFGDRDALWGDATHFVLRKSELIAVLKQLGLSPKGKSFKTISKIMERNFGQPNMPAFEIPITLSKLLSLLPKDIIDIIASKVDEKYSARLCEEKNSRRTIPPPVCDSLVVAPAPVAEAAKEIDQTFEDFDDDDTPKVDVEKLQQEAALVMQRIARGAKAREVFVAKLEHLEDEKVRGALQKEEFFDFAGDILRNTMLNLIEEASYEEFAIDADPLAFALKN